MQSDNTRKQKAVLDCLGVGSPSAPVQELFDQFERKHHVSVEIEQFVTC